MGQGLVAWDEVEIEVLLTTEAPNQLLFRCRCQQELGLDPLCRIKQIGQLERKL